MDAGVSVTFHSEAGNRLPPAHWRGIEPEHARFNGMQTFEILQLALQNSSFHHKIFYSAERIQLELWVKRGS
jgi:hypothetical protein